MERIYFQDIAYLLAWISMVLLIIYMRQTSTWRYWVQVVAWLINVLVFYTFVIGNYYGLLVIPVGISFTDWSAIIRLQAVVALLTTLLFLTDWKKLWNGSHQKC